MFAVIVVLVTHKNLGDFKIRTNKITQSVFYIFYFNPMDGFVATGRRNEK
jgi:hypothetical protein